MIIVPLQKQKVVKQNGLIHIYGLMSFVSKNEGKENLFHFFVLKYEITFYSVDSYLPLSSIVDVKKLRLSRYRKSR